MPTRNCRLSLPLFIPPSLTPSLRLSVGQCLAVGGAGGLDVDPGQGVGSGRGDEGLGRVEGHVVDGLFALLPVGRDLLDAGLTVQVPETQRAVVT